MLGGHSSWPDIRGRKENGCSQRLSTPESSACPELSLDESRWSRSSARSARADQARSSTDSARYAFEGSFQDDRPRTHRKLIYRSGLAARWESANHLRGALRSAYEG